MKVYIPKRKERPTPISPNIVIAAVAVTLSATGNHTTDNIGAADTVIDETIPDKNEPTAINLKMNLNLY